ncbi:MAG: hypothetical protein K0Q51_1443 [Rickettsiaceae bacterium]|jgi:PIN domain nuclease of toxin-antitoxin system|nr:hypothetical protein [Rickettsiaceae bacterium]
MNKVIYDSSALLAIINQETGYEEIEKLLPYSSMSMVNVTEVVSVLAREGVPEDEIKSIIEEIIPEIIPYDYDISFLAGTLIQDTQKFGLSLADRACIATALNLGREIYTTDKAWEKVTLPQNVKVHYIR